MSGAVQMRIPDWLPAAKLRFVGALGAPKGVPGTGEVKAPTPATVTAATS